MLEVAVRQSRQFDAWSVRTAKQKHQIGPAGGSYPKRQLNCHFAERKVTQAGLGPDLR